MRIDFSRPDVIFAATWLLVMAIYLPIPSIITPPMTAGVAGMIAFNVLSAPVIYFVVRTIITKKYGAARMAARPALSRIDQHILADFLYLLMLIWIAIFLAGIVYSGGLPLQWYLTGAKLQYSDFGIPTVSGLGEMLCCFGSVLCVVLFLVSRRWWFLFLWLVHLLPSIVEVSRGGIFFFICQSVAAVLLLQKLNWRQLLSSTAILVFAFGMFVVLGSLRGATMKSTDFEGVGDYLGGLPVGVYWVWSYVATPLGNVVHAASLDIPHSYYPNYSLVYLLPNFLRLTLSKDQIYTPLTSEAFNATSIYAPLYMDFGLIGAAAVVALLLLVASYVHVMAKRGELFYITLYPALFASLALSFFHIFALTPSVVAVPLVCLWMRNFIRRKHAVSALASASAGRIPGDGLGAQLRHS